MGEFIKLKKRSGLKAPKIKPLKTAKGLIQVALGLALVGAAMRRI